MGERLVLQGFLDSFAETSVGYETPVVLETPKLVVSTNTSLPQYIPVVKKNRVLQFQTLPTVKDLITGFIS
jgi:RNase P/RNase MRP subunit p29